MYKTDVYIRQLDLLCHQGIYLQSIYYSFDIITKHKYKTQSYELELVLFIRHMCQIKVSYHFFNFFQKRKSNFTVC